jgi:hypothetical protein
VNCEELAWAAGFIEGEGCFHGGLTKNSRKRRLQRYITFTVTQTNMEPLERLQRLFGGHIYSAKRQKAHHAEAWQYRMASIGDVRNVAKQISPWLGTAKSEQARLAIESYLRWDAKEEEK